MRKKVEKKITAKKQRKKTVSPKSGSDITAHQFKPGQSGNPAGKPQGAIHIRTVAQKILDSAPPKALLPILEKYGLNPKAASLLDVIIVRSVQTVIKKGDATALEKILNEYRGHKLPQTLELESGDPDKPLFVLSVKDREKARKITDKLPEPGNH